MRAMQSLRWEAHTCLPLHPDATFGLLDGLRAAGVNYASVNVGMDMNPVTQIMSVIAGFTARLAEHSDHFVLVRCFEDIEQAAAGGKLGRHAGARL